MNLKEVEEFAKKHFRGFETKVFLKNGKYILKVYKGGAVHETREWNAK